MKKIIWLHKKYSEWKLIINIKNIKYKICLNGVTKEDKNIYSKEFTKTYEKIIENKKDNKEVLSQDEIAMLLTEIKEPENNN